MVDNREKNLFSWFRQSIITQDRLHLVFWVIGGLVVMLTAFSAYSLQQLGNALEITINKSMPMLSSALHLSEQSTRVSAAAPGLALVHNEKELSETYLELESLLSSIRTIATTNLQSYQSEHVDLLINDTIIMEKVLGNLETNVNERLSLNRRQKFGLTEVHDVQKSLTEIMNPVEYGVISLTNLFGKRAVRSLERSFEKLSKEDDSMANRSAFSIMLADEISYLTETAIKDMGYALNLKSSGNNLVNLLFILSGAETTEQVNLLQNQFSTAMSNFSHSAKVFAGSTLARRNPLLSESVYSVSKQFYNFNKGKNSLFALRDNQLLVKASGRNLLEQIESITIVMIGHSKDLADHVDQRMQKLQQKMARDRKTGIAVILLTSGGCLLLVSFMGYGTIIAIRQQDEALQKSHNELEQKVTARTRELQKTYQQLAHAGRLTSLGEMATGIAHEINQPLNIIALAVQTLKRYFSKHGVDRSAAESVDTIQAQVDRAATIISNMRSFSRTDSNDHVPINLVEPVELALSFFTEQLRLNQIRLSTVFADNLPMVKADSCKFEQIVVNLLSNSRYAVEKMSESAGDGYQKEITVKLFHDPKQGVVVFELADNGTGMSDKVEEHCMEPFFTTKETGQGTGLGLSISHTLVTTFGGSMELTSKQGKGCAFTILLPEISNDN